MTNPTRYTPPSFGRGSYAPKRKRLNRKIVAGGAIVVVLALVLVILGPLMHLLPGFRYNVLFAKDLTSKAAPAPVKRVKGYSSKPVSQLSAQEQQVVATEQQAQNTTLKVAQSYATNQWCRALYASAGKGTPQPPDPTQGLGEVEKKWTNAGVVGKVTANFCTIAYFSKDWYLLGVPFGPVNMSAANSYEPLAVEMEYTTPGGATYHVFFIEVVQEEVRAAFSGTAPAGGAPQTSTVTGSHLVAMYWDTKPVNAPEWVTSQTNFIIPGDAVVSPAIGLRPPLAPAAPVIMHAPAAKKK